MNTFLYDDWFIAVVGGIIVGIVLLIIEKARKPIRLIREIPLVNCIGLCIGEHTHEGCIVKYNEEEKTIISEINFDKTNANICSTIIRTGDLDMRKHVAKKRKMYFEIYFDIRASDANNRSDTTNKIIVLELMLKDRENFSKEISVSSSDWEKKSIPLSDFLGVSEYWKQLKEIKFFLRRSDNNGQGGTLKIRNIEIKR